MGEGEALRSVSTFTATVYVGLRERSTGLIHDIGEAIAICSSYCDEVGLCVTVTPTQFVYTGGGEPGVAVGFINYPRFPASAAPVREQALTLAERLQVALGQLRVSVVMPDETVMLSATEES